jgi:hypothetical protein
MSSKHEGNLAGKAALASGDWAVPQKAATALDRYGVWMRSQLWWRLSPDRNPRTLPARILLWMAE